MRKEIVVSATHPGVWLKEKYMKPAGITAQQLAEETGLNDYLLGLIMEGEYTVSDYAAQLLGKKFGFQPAIMINMQAEYDQAYKQAAADQ